MRSTSGSTRTLDGQPARAAARLPHRRARLPRAGRPRRDRQRLVDPRAHGTLPGWVAYAAAKGGIEALTRGVCVEYGQLGIRCNAVAPGAVLTDATRARARRGARPRRDAARGWRALSPMDVVLEPDDVAAGVAFLLSPQSRYLNGHVLRIDAGHGGGWGERPAAAGPAPRQKVRGAVRWS